MLTVSGSVQVRQRTLDQVGDSAGPQVSEQLYLRSQVDRGVTRGTCAYVERESHNERVQGGRRIEEVEEEAEEEKNE